MADQYNDKTGSAGSVIDDDDPLAELARIIGYDRPAEAKPQADAAGATTHVDPDEIDLEAELLRELETSYEETVSAEAVAAPEPAIEPAPAQAYDPYAMPHLEETSQFEEHVPEPEAEDVSAEPVAGAPEEQPFDPFVAEAPSIETDDTPFTSLMDDELNLPEDELYQALEDELTITADDLPDYASETEDPEPLVADFGDEELPASEAAFAHNAEEAVAPDAGSEDDAPFYPEEPYYPEEELRSEFSDPHAVSDPVEEAEQELSAEAPDAEDFDDVFAEWDAFVEAAATDENSADLAQEPDDLQAEPSIAWEPDLEPETADDAISAPEALEIPVFPGSSPVAGEIADAYTVEASAQAGAYDGDDILADISRFDLPSHGHPESKQTDIASAGSHQLHQSALVDAPELAATVEAFLAEDEASLENVEPDTSDFDPFEAELSAELDDYRSRLETGEMTIEDVPAEPALAVGEHPQIEEAFDEKVEDFLAEEDFDLALDDFNPVDDIEEDASETVEATAEEIVALEDAFAPDEAATAAAIPVDKPDADPADLETSDDDMAVAFSRFFDEAEATPADETPADETPDMPVDELSADIAPEPARPQFGDSEFDAFFPQQPVEPVAAVAAAAAAASIATASPAGPAQAEEADDDDWLASLEAQVEEDVAEQESATIQAGQADAEPEAAELPEPEMPYAVAAEGHDMAFDESAITPVDEMPGSIGDLEIPDLPSDQAPAEDDFETLFESELDREFADLVEGEAQTEEPVAADAGWYAPQTEPAAQQDNYDDMESDLGFTGASDTAYRPHPQPVDADIPYETVREREADDRRKPLIAGVVLGVAVLLGGTALAWNWIAGGSSSDDGPKVIMADKDPVKVVPENPGGAKVPNQDKAVYEKVEGNDTGAASQPRLVESAEEPVDVVQRTIDPDVLPLEGRGEAETAAGATEKVEDRLTEGDTESAAAGSSAEQLLSPRRVRTMIVRPDGTIVPRSEPQAEAAETPAPAAASVETVPATPVAPEASTTDVASADPEIGLSAPATVTADGEIAGTAAAEGEVAANPTIPTQTVTTVPVPTSRPSEQPVNVVGQVSGNGRVSEVASAAPQTAAPAAPAAQTTAAANPGGYYMQIASQPSAAGAQTSYDDLSRRYSSIIGGRGVDIKSAEIPNRGTYHRVRIPAGTREEANALCARYKAAGGSCIVTR
ncbi:hypothetical protein E2A64_08965 [Pseudohoeflea suaedae]|uniref:SPOR domain-containing protein n=1 Tax=Pseudohoeflea suaedae TaxID=877384 RepID=A0A4R5PQK7_9HYPH|nr:SPOR domain-containing protein [Pseudohoeflea suaedae]TDH39183.1 hypothetical protein E2A64_08965 [Pseudohoeflea suaedae]